MQIPIRPGTATLVDTTRAMPLIVMVFSAIVFGAMVFTEGAAARTPVTASLPVDAPATVKLHPRGNWSGFENNEEALGKAVAKAIMEASPTRGLEHDFTGREKPLGQAVATAIKTLNVRQPYQHEMNDALVKMTLNYIQFAKDHNLVNEMIDHEARIEAPMLTRNRQRIQASGDQELALVAVTDRTACFYQLALEVRREPGKISYRDPFVTVLTMTRQLGQHNLTPKELHEIWTVPRYKRQAGMMGVNIDVSPWREDGWITLSLVDAGKVAAAN